MKIASHSLVYNEPVKYQSEILVVINLLLAQMLVTKLMVPISFQKRDLTLFITKSKIKTLKLSFMFPSISPYEVS